MNNPVFEVRAGGTLRNCKVIGRDTAYGVLINGNGATVQHVTVEHFSRGFQIENCEQATIQYCKSNYNTLFGFNAENCADVLFDECDGQYNGLDGFKLRVKALNTIFLNCTASHNGQDPANAGDGIDVYGGGDGALIEGGNYSHNLGNGLTLKTDTGNRDEPEVYGMVRNLTVRGVTCNNNTGWGIAAFSGFEPDIPLLENVTIEGATCQNNVMDGLLINAGDVTIDGLNASPNGRYGVYIDTRSENVSLTNVVGDVVDARE